MVTTKYTFEQITINHDKKRKPLSAKERATMQGEYRYFGAQNVIDHVNDYLFDGEYLLIAEDGENLKSNKQNIAQIVEGKFWLNNHAHIVQTNELCNIHYLNYWLNTADISGYITGSAQPKLSQANMNAITIDLPSREIQDKIVSVLLGLDKRIQCNRAINETLLSIGDCMYRELVSSCNTSVKLGDIIENIETGSRPKGGAQTDGIPSVGAEKIECFGVYDYAGEKYISEEYFNKLKRGKIESGDVLLYKDGAYTGKTSLALDGFPHEKCAINEHVFKLNTYNNKYQFFLYFTLADKKNREFIYKLASGKAAQPGLNQVELAGVEVALPSEDHLDEFETKVSEIMHLIAKNALENRQLALIREGLTPKLMAGDIDLGAI